MNADNCSIDEDVFKVRIICQGLENALENTLLRPTAEPPKDAVPLSKPRGKITPGATNSNPPQDRLQKQARVTASRTGITLLAGHKRFDK